MTFGHWAVAVGGGLLLLSSCARKGTRGDSRDPEHAGPIYSTDLDDCDFTGSTEYPELRETGELLEDLFRNFDTPLCRADVVASLESRALEFDLSATYEQRSIALTPLYAEDQLVTPPPDVDPESQVGVMLVGASTHDVNEHLETALDPNQVCLQEPAIVYYGRSFVSDDVCFSNGGCSELRTSAEVRYDNLLAGFWYDEFVDYGVISMPSGRHAIVSRTWIEAVAVAHAGQGEYRQRYGLDIWYEDPADPGATVWLAARWSELVIPSLGEDQMGRLLLDGLADRMSSTDDFVDGVECRNDRDFPYDRQ